MIHKEILLKITNERIYLNPTLSIPIHQTTLPSNEYLKFVSRRDIFWKVEQLDYEPVQKCLIVQIIDYDSQDISLFENQKPKKVIERIDFGKYNWSKLEPILQNYQLSKFSNDLENYTIEPSFYEAALSNQNENSSSLNIQNKIYQHEEKEDDGFRVYTEQVKISFKDAFFMLGCVSFKIRIKRLLKEFELTIPNEYILAEFENIKTWFGKKFKDGKFIVKLIYRLNDRHELIEIIHSSPDIDEINPELIDSIKFKRTFALFSSEPFDKSNKKILFTSDNIFDQFDSNKPEGNVFNQSDKDLLNLFTQKKVCRNRKQLEYLSGNLQSLKHKLRYTLKPHFGFLFLVEGLKYNHFVWELLNSNATYIWSLDKSDFDIEIQFKHIENEIFIIREEGRKPYKNALKNNQYDNDLIFKLITHEDIDSKTDDSFLVWEKKVKEQLV